MGYKDIMSKRYINPPQLFNSARYGFSQVTSHAGGGELFTTSGQVALNKHEQVVGSTLHEQMDRCVHNLELALRASGGGLGDILSLRIYVVQSEIDNLQAIGEVLRKYFGTEDPPSSTWIGVAFLARKEFLVEVEAIGVIDHNET